MPVFNRLDNKKPYHHIPSVIVNQTYHKSIHDSSKSPGLLSATYFNDSGEFYFVW